MLESLDVLIGFTTVMLLASMAVTFLTQAVIEILNLRGRKLWDGLSLLLRQVNPEALRPHARQIARAVLKHPLVGAGGRLGGVIQREEFVEMLLELASRKAPPPALPDDAREALARALAASGVTDPDGALRAMRSRTVDLEAEYPRWAAHLRRSKAMFETVSSQWVRHAAASFDTAMDRVSHAFERHVRFYTAVFSLLLAAGLQLDAFGLLNRLSLDESLRRALVTEAAGIDDRLQASAAGEERTRLEQRVRDLREMASSPLVVPPARWLSEWDPWKLPGILISALLLSLGAPFWYGQLKNLLRLRPLLAAKEEEERQERWTSQLTPEAVPRS